MPGVSLHLPESDHKAMVTLVANSGVRREVDVTMDSDDVGEEIAAGEREVLKDEVDAIVCILDTRDRDIQPTSHQREQHLTSQPWQNHLPNILPQIWLELQAPLAIKQQIPRQPRPILPESFICGVLAHPFEPVPDGLEEVFIVRFVFPIVDLAAGIADLVAAGVGVGFEDVACLEEDL